MALLDLQTQSEAKSKLMDVLESVDIEPGTPTSYETCKIIYLYHPLGGKMVDRPIRMGQSQRPLITVKNAPSDLVVKAFWDEWDSLGADNVIAETVRLSRIYGHGTTGAIVPGTANNQSLTTEQWRDPALAFNVWDPLNVAGSMICNINPNAPDFLKHDTIRTAGTEYAAGRTCTLQNESGIYLAYTESGYGYTGRSVYQRALYPLKSFVQGMRTDNHVLVKCGMLIAKIFSQTSMANAVAEGISKIKRIILRQGKTGDVVQIGAQDSIESIDLTNLQQPMDSARQHVLADIAAAADMPAIMLNSETFTRGFGEGTEDAKSVASYIDGLRADWKPLYNFFIRIVQLRAWTEEFYATIQASNPDLANVPYATAYAQWCNAFEFTWPSYLIEPESKQVEVDKIKFEAVTSMLEVMLPNLDPENKAALLEWAMNNLNEANKLFKNKLVLDIQALAAYQPPAPAETPDPRVETL
jgi:hypothetical protein